MSEFLEFTVIGVAVGAGYAILASGLVVTYNTSGVFNFAHGAVAMIAAFSYWEMLEHQVPELLAMALALLVGAPLLGLVMEWGLMRQLHGATAERPIIVTLGLLVVLLGAGTLIWSVSTSRVVRPLVAGTFPLFGVDLQWQNLVLLVAAAVVAALLWLLFSRTRLGTGMRAVVDDPELLTLSGVSPHRMSRAGWVLGFFLAALAGVLIAPTLTNTFSVPIMTLLVVNGYAAAVVGRLRSVPWTFAGAVVLGLVVTYFGGYAPQHLPQGVGADLTSALPMIFLFVALVALPSIRLGPAGRLSAARVPRVAGRGESSVAGAVVIVGVVVVSLLLGGNFLAPGLSTLGPIAGQTLVYGIVALSLVLLVGYAGQVSLCQFAFMGIGAFCMGKVAGGGSVVGLIVGVVVCAAVGALVALPVTRLRGLYLALATFAFAEAVQYGFFADIHVFGAAGIEVGRFSVAGISFSSDRAELVLLGVVFAVVAVGVLAIRRGRFGRRLVALNDSPAAYVTVGLSPGVTKVAVFSLAAAIAGIGGALWGTLQGTVGQGTFTIFSGVMFVLFLVIWGARTVTGGFLAALTYAVFTNVGHLTRVEGIFAGVGIVVVGRAANGILGAEWLADRVHLPWVAPAGRSAGARSDLPALPSPSGPGMGAGAGS